MAELLLSETKDIKTYLVENSRWGATVIKKELAHPYPSQTIIQNFLFEYNLLAELNLTGLRKPVSKENEEGNPTVYYEYFDGITIKKLVQNGKNDINLALSAGLFLAEKLIQLHDNKVIHKGISANNLLFNSKNQEFCLIDFSNSTTIKEKKHILGNPEQIAGDLEYISPEQTGRMNRMVDHRTDLYSTGIVLYEMLTGRLPFQANDPREIVYGHIATIPENPRDLAAHIPVVFSKIIMKLIEKDADERYQSAVGLKEDLKKLQQDIIRGVKSNFEIARYDKAITLSISQKLYGREKEIEALKLHLVKVVEGGFGVDMIYGFSGSGKSSLVHEVFKTISKNKGYFITGKFDQLQQNIPYHAIRKAFKEYFSFLLTEDGEYIDTVRKRILSAVGNEGALIIEIIPELEHIIGKQPAVTALSGVIGQNRFIYTFSMFLKAITDSEHPIILFIDDLQWADLASLNLISYIMRERQIGYLLLIGSYRENEVSETHPLTQLISAAEDFGVEINKIKTENLTKPDVTNLLLDSFSIEADKIGSLANLLINQAGGNAFYTIQILQNLYEQGYLYYDNKARGWQWDSKNIRKINIPDNIVDLMLDKVKQLDTTTQDLLKLGSCFGHSFLRTDLELLSNSPSNDFSNALINAQEVGLIFEGQGDFKFAHDRIQQAVYSLIPEDERTSFHYTIGISLQKKYADDQEKQFYIIDQLNFAQKLVTDDGDKLKYAELNLKAGTSAKSSTAYDTSLEYLKKGLAFCKNDWASHYELVLGLHTNAAESAYLVGKYDEVAYHTQEVIEHASVLLDKIPVLKIQIEAYKAQNNLIVAVDKGLEALRMLDVKLPNRPNKLQVLVKLITTRIKTIGKSPEGLLGNKTMDDPFMLAAMQILVSIGPAIYWASPNLTPITIFKMLLISIKYGNTDESTFAYSTFGLLLCGVTGEIKLGNRFGKLALDLSEKVNDVNKVKGVFNTYCFVHHWSHPLSNSFSPFKDAFQLGQASGDLEFSALSAYLYCNHAFYAGKPLSELEHEFEIYSEEIRRIKQYTPLNYNLLHWQVALNLMKETSNPMELNGPAYHEKQMLRVHEQANDKTALFKYHLLKMMLKYLFGSHIEAFEHGLNAAKYIDAVTGMYVTVAYQFYFGLVIASNENSDKLSLRPRTSNKKLAPIIKKFKKWSVHNPANNKHKYQLLLAEYHRSSGKIEKARNMYQAAISSARESDSLNELAIANELAGKFMLANNNEILANFYFVNAYTAYHKWGAITKCNELKITYDLENFSAKNPNPFSTGASLGSGANPMANLDIRTITEVAENISKEIEFDHLKSTLIKILAENAGAEKAILFMVNDNEINIGESWPDQRESTKLFPASIINQVLENKDTIVTDRAHSDTLFKDDPYINKNEIRSVLCLPLEHQNDLIAIIYLENNIVYGAFSQQRIQFLQLLSGQIAISLKNSSLYQNLTDAYNEQVELREAYSKFVPRDFLNFLGKESILDVALGDQIQKTVTIMFIDIVDYTALSENMTPKENFDFINGLLRLLGPIFRDHGGFISQFLGDGAMAIFKDAPNTAIQASVEIQNTLREYNVGRENKGRRPVKVGVGIHSGNVMLGIIGEKMRMDQNVISDDVNIASRVQDLTRVYGTGVLITANTRDMLTEADSIKLRYLGPSDIKGRKGHIEIYECLNGLSETEAVLKSKSQEYFTAGITAHFNAKYAEALSAFQKVLKIDPEDKAAQKFIEWGKDLEASNYQTKSIG